MALRVDPEGNKWSFNKIIKVVVEVKIIPKLRRITVEPLLLINVIGLGAMFVTYQSFIIRSICTRRNGEPNATVIDCNNLQEFPDDEEAVQGEAVEYLTLRRMLETSILVFYSLFLGDWVQKNGSKSMMVLPLIGFLLSAVCLYFLAQFPGAPTGAILLASLPNALGGANFAFVLATNNYITRITTTENRSFRLAMAESSAILGFPIGLWTGSQMRKATGFTGVFLLCTGLQGAALLYTLFFVKNDGPSTNLSPKMFKGLCNLNSIKKTVRLCTQPRDGSKQLWLLLIFVIWGLRVLAFTGMENVFFLYTRLKFEWSSVEYTQYAMSESLLVVAGIIILTFLGIKLLKLKDTTLGVLASLCTLIATLVFAFASTGWMAYLALGFQMFGGIIAIIVRSMLSKLVSMEEVASAFVWNGIIESVIPLVSAPLYGLIYSFTLDTLPNAVFFVTAGGCAIGLAIFLYLAAVIPAKRDNRTLTPTNSVSLVSLLIESQMEENE